MSILSLFYRNKRRLNNWLQLRRVRKCGVNINVFGKVSIVNPENLTIGNNCSLNHDAYINAFNPITLGDDVTISASVKVVSTGIDYLSWANGKKQHTQNGDIVIGDHVWIGCGAIIAPGVKITGEYVVIAAGAVVTHDITEDHSIYAGCPAKKVKEFQ